MPRAPKTLLDEARQVLRAGLAADNRLWRRNHNIEDLYRDYYTQHDTPMRGPGTLYWQNKRDNVMNAYLEAARLNERLDARRREIEDATRRYEYAKKRKQELLERLLREQEEWRVDDEMRNRNPKFYDAKGSYFDFKIPKVRDEIDNFEIPPAGWRGY